MPFQPGQSGNPKGRASEKPFRVAIDMELKAAGEDHKKLRAIAKRLLDEAEKGEAWAVKEVADRLDGKPTQIMDVDVTLTQEDAIEQLE